MDTENRMPMPEVWEAPTEPTPEEREKELKKKIKKSYGNAALILIMQFVISTMISGMITTVYAVIATVKLMMAEGVENIIDPEMIVLKVSETMMNPVFLLVTVIVSYLVANLLSYVFGNAINKKYYRADMFGKIALRPLDCVLAVFAVLGVQMLSLLIQSLIVSLTNVNGMDESMMAMMSFSDNAAQNVLLILYTVVIAAVTEELLCRGAVMKALSPVSTSFALVASSLLFGIMHGNFNQMLNGFLLGLVIGYAGIKSRSVFLPILLHMCANGHAMLLSFLEYKLGEKMLAAEGVYIIVLGFVGLAAAVLLVLRNGKPNDAQDGYPCTHNIEDLALLQGKKGLTWKTLIKSPCFWIFTAIYFVTAIFSLSPMA